MQIGNRLAYTVHFWNSCGLETNVKLTNAKGQRKEQKKMVLNEGQVKNQISYRRDKESK